MKIEIKNITKIYPRGKKKALNGVNIEIGQGIFGLIGRNGAGKTTLMRIIATIMDATEGEIYFDGKELKANKDEFRSSLGYLPQSTKLMPRMNIVEFLDYVCILKGIKDKKERKERITQAIETVGLVGEEKKRLKAYSGGMLRRAGIAQALIGDPKVLIIDEPTTDDYMKHKINRRIQKYYSVMQLLADNGIKAYIFPSSHTSRSIPMVFFLSFISSATASSSLSSM